MLNNEHAHFDSDQHPTSLQLQNYLQCLLSGSGQPDDLVESHLQECRVCRKRLQEEIEFQAMRTAAKRDQVLQTAGITARSKRERGAHFSIPFQGALSAAAVLALVVAAATQIAPRTSPRDSYSTTAASKNTIPSDGDRKATQQTELPGTAGSDKGKAASTITVSHDQNASGPDAITLSPALPSFPRQYEVKDRDTLSRIALAQYGNPKYWVDILRENHIVMLNGEKVYLTHDARNLRPGMQLTLPKVSDDNPV